MTGSHINIRISIVNKLCFITVGLFFFAVINECALIPDLCLNGVCVDTDASFTCTCHQGYRYDPQLFYCVDVDECTSLPCHETANCRNEPGSFRCVCADGFFMNPADGSCSG